VDVYRLPSGEIIPVTGRIAAIKKAYRELRTLSVSLVGG